MLRPLWGEWFDILVLFLAMMPDIVLGFGGCGRLWLWMRFLLIRCISRHSCKLDRVCVSPHVASWPIFPPACTPPPLSPNTISYTHHLFSLRKIECPHRSVGLSLLDLASKKGAGSSLISRKDLKVDWIGHWHYLLILCFLNNVLNKDSFHSNIHFMK